MSIPDSRAGRSKANTVRYGKERLSLTAMSRKWNIVKVICCQKYNSTEQFGLQRISFFNDVCTPKTPNSNSSVNQILTSPPSSNNTPHRVPVLPGSRNSSLRRVRSSSENAQTATKITPKQPPRKHGLNEVSGLGEDDNEFLGVELQSRLYKNCMRGKSSTATLSDSNNEPNQFLNRIATPPSVCSYQRTKLLKKELPKAKGLLDFTQTYKCEETKSSPSIGGAFNRLAACGKSIRL